MTTSPERAQLLELDISPAPTHGQHRWVDGKRQRLEDRLGEILLAITRAAGEAARRNDELERERQQLHARWEAAMARAKVLAVHDRHLRVLRTRVDEWKFAEDLRAYVQAVRDQLAEHPEANAERILSWLAWAERFLEQYDPVAGFPQLPSDTEPTAKELEPHLGGLSPYEPHH